MEAVFGFLKVVILCIAGLIALFLVLLVLPNSPVKELVMRFLKPAAITTGAALIGTDITAMFPFVGEVGDLGLLALAGWAWLSYFKDMKVMMQSHMTQRGTDITQR